MPAPSSGPPPTGPPGGSTASKAQLKESGGQPLGIGSITDGQYLKRSGLSIVGDAGAGSTDLDTILTDGANVLVGGGNVLFRV